jgi:zinc protease
MGTRPENRDAAVAKLIEELERVRKQPAPLDEIERAKEYIAGSYEIGLQTASSQAANLALNERYGLGWAESVEYPDRIRRVSPEDVWYVAKKYLLMDRYVITELLPVPETTQSTEGEYSKK